MLTIYTQVTGLDVDGDGVQGDGLAVTLDKMMRSHVTVQVDTHALETGKKERERRRQLLRDEVLKETYSMDLPMQKRPTKYVKRDLKARTTSTASAE
jgi:hypothetical protein